MKKDNCFVIIIAIFIFGVFVASPVTYILSKNGIINVANVGNIIEKENEYGEDHPLSSFLNGIEEGKRTVNDIYINYVPGYVPITTFSTNLTNSLNAGITDALGAWGDRVIRQALEEKKEPTPTPPSVSGSETEADITRLETEATEPEVSYKYKASLMTDDQTQRYYKITAQGSDSSTVEFLQRVPSPKHRMLEARMKKQIELINKMYEASTDVNMYIYIPTCIEDTELGLEMFPAESTKDLFDTFVSSLNEGISLDYLKINSLEDRLTKLFITDHHWNRYGSYEGYTQIVDMLKANYPDLGDAREIVEDCRFDDIELYGSMAMAVNSYELSDKFGILDLALPKHTLKKNTNVPYGGQMEFEKRLSSYKDGNYKKDKSYNHFLNFYRIAKLIEYPENNTGRNLLLIGDSFSPCITEAIASHFDKTIVRYVDSNEPVQIDDYNEYLKENNITDVLILETSSRLVLNLYKDALTNISFGGNK